MLVTPVVTDAGPAHGLGTVIAALSVTPATTGADVDWSVVAGPVVDGFRIDATRAGASVPERTIGCDASRRSMPLRGLRAGATYVVTVSALRAGVVVDTASATVRTGPALASVHATAVAAGVHVTWTKYPGAAIQGFRVAARPPGAARPTVSTDTEAETTDLVLRGLRPLTRYTVTVHALFDAEPTDGLAVTATAAAGAPYWPGWDIGRGVALAPAGGGYTLDAWGAVHAWADAEHAAPPAPARVQYWRGRDVTRGLALLPDGSGGLILDGTGRIRTFGIGAHAAPTVRGNTVTTTDTFRGIALLPGGNGGYTVDASGALHPFAIGRAALPPAAHASAGWPGRDVARAVAITSDGRGGFVVDAFGHGFGFSIGPGRAPRPPRTPVWAFAIVRAASLRPGGGTGVVLDGFGGVHPVRAG